MKSMMDSRRVFMGRLLPSVLEMIKVNIPQLSGTGKEMLGRNEGAKIGRNSDRGVFHRSPVTISQVGSRTDLGRMMLQEI
jgi:hypothetical protein